MGVHGCFFELNVPVGKGWTVRPSIPECLLHALLVSLDHLLEHVTRTNFVIKSRCGSKTFALAVTCKSRLTQTNFEPLQVLFRGFSRKNPHIQPNTTIFFHGHKDLVDVLVNEAAGDHTGLSAGLGGLECGADLLHVLLKFMLIAS